MTARALVALWRSVHRHRCGIDLDKLLDALVRKLDQLEAELAAREAWHD